jgi:aspartate/methionine/tyrosine aminotransferase
MESWFAEIEKQKPMIQLDKGQIKFFHSKQILVDAIRDLEQESFAYPTNRPLLIDALRYDLRKTRGLPTSAHQLVVTHGAIGGIYSSFQALCRPTDEILLPLPVWPAVVDMVHLTGAVPVFYPFLKACDAEALAERVVSLSNKKTRILFLNTPHNPTGLFLTYNQAARVLQAAKKAGLIVISDEAYESLGIGGKPCRLLHSDHPEAEEAVLLLSVSKRFAFPGLRLGFVRAPKKLAEKIACVSHLATGGISNLAQEAGTEVLKNGCKLEKQIALQVAQRRQKAESMLCRWGCPIPENRCGLYVFLDLPGRKSGWDVSRALLSKGVGVVPGEIFGKASRLRISLTAPIPILERGLKLIAEVLKL